MYKITSTWGKCTAHITTNKNRVKVYDKNKVFLKDKQNFEIELFNPTDHRVLIVVKLNGKSISESGIVLRPGERQYLERFIDENKRFIFETYHADGSKEAQKAIEKNGLVELIFYPEIEFSWKNGTDITIYNDSNMSTPTPFFTTSDWVNPNYINFHQNTQTFDKELQFSKGSIGSYTVAGTTVNNISVTNSVSGYNSSDQIETGRVEGGTKTEQYFETVNGNFSWVACENISYSLLPESMKPVEISQLRNYCSGCGTRMKKSSWKFCPSCGEKINN